MKNFQINSKPTKIPYRIIVYNMQWENDQTPFLYNWQRGKLEDLI